MKFSRSKIFITIGVNIYIWRIRKITFGATFGTKLMLFHAKIVFLMLHHAFGATMWHCALFSFFLLLLSAVTAVPRAYHHSARKIKKAVNLL